MITQDYIEDILGKVCDLAFAFLPARIPEKNRLKDVKIIAHRGVHDNKNVLENTLPAFELALENKLWGIEFDVQFTKDFIPVILHEQSLDRLFNRPLSISEINYSKLAVLVPQIPTLELALKKYGQKIHLMIEIKDSAMELNVEKILRLKENFKGLTPIKDFHILSLSPEIFKLLSFWPSETFLAIATTNTKIIHQEIMDQPIGGFLGHYLLLNNKYISYYKEKNLKIGTGLIYSAPILFRELNRGVDWIFTNHPLELKKICQMAIK